MNDFGSVLVNTTSGTASFTVTNTGEATSGSITPVITGTNAADFTATNGCTTLAGAGTCVITVTFHPTSAQPNAAKSASLVVSGSPGGTVMAALLGTAQIPGTLTISPSSLTFGNVTVGATGTQQVFTITNAGSVPTTGITITKAGSDPAEFTQVAGAGACTNGQVLAAAATCTITANFAPNSAGAKSASFIVSATTGGSVNGSVAGTGVAQANLTLNPTLQDFGTVTLGSSSANVTFTVQNIGGVASSAIGQSGTGDYTIVNSNCAGVLLAPLATCNIIVRFTPTVQGTRPGTLDITATTGGSRTATLTGVGVPAGNIQFAVTDSPFSFPDTTTGQTSTSHLFTITNTGGSPTGALGTALGGVAPGQFTIVAGSNGCQGVVLAAGGTCTIAAVFNPTSGGLKSATLTVTGSPGGTAQANISGTGIAPAQFSFNLASSDYGSVVTGTQSAIVPFTLTNIGGQTSALPAIAINGTNASEFMITSNGCTAALTAAPAAGSSCVVSVWFIPTSVGAKVATLDVTGTPGGPIHSDLSGLGVAQAAIAVTPSILNWPSTLVGDTNVLVQNFTVTNQGSVNTGDMTITITGLNPGDFSQTNNCTDGPVGPGVDFLIPNGQCTVSVTYAPQARGDRHATVNITATPGAPTGVTVALNGLNALPRLEILTPAPVTIPNTHDFGSSIVDPNPGLVNTTLVTVVNNTALSQTITNAETDATVSFFPTAGCTGAVVGAGATCAFTVGFAPHQVGAVAGSYLLSITGVNATGCPVALPNCNTATQQVNGVGTNDTIRISDGDATPTAHNFGNQGTGTSSQVRTFTVTNLGTSNTGVLAVDLTGTGFQITNNNCSGVVLTTFGPGPGPAAGATCTIGVVFTPTALVTSNATITVRTSLLTTLGGTVMATVSGTGVAPAPLANPTMIDWGTLFAGDPTGTAATDKVITITNPNDLATTLNVTLFDSATPGTWFTGVNSAANTCGAWTGPGNSALTNPSLGAGLSCNLVVRFTPLLPIGARPGAHLDATLTVGNLKASVALAAAVRSTISYVAAPTNFVDVVAGTTATQTIMVHNDSTQTLTGFVMNAGGAPYFIFNNTCNAGSLGPNGTCQFDLQYAPGLPGGATDAASVVVTATNGSMSASVVGNSFTPASVTVAPGAFSFGSEILGQNGSSFTFKFTNDGQQASSTFSPALAGAQAGNWSITATTCGGVIAGGGSCTATVRFNPTTAGALAANLTGTAVTGGTAAAAVLGTGVAAGGLRVSPTSFTFADTTAGAFSATQTFTVQNTSGAVAAALAITPSANFTDVGTGTCGVSLAAGASCTVIVRFTPAAPGFVSGTLAIDGTTFADLYGRGLTGPNVTSNLGGTFANNAGISINDFPATSAPFPSTITVAGVNGNVSNLRVRLNSFSHTYPGDVDVVLQAPDGTRMMLMSDVGGSIDAVGLNLTIDDAAATGFPATLASGTFRPTNVADGIGTDPVANGGTLAANFNGIAANGVWELYVVDDAGADSGALGGWALEINGSGFPDTAIGAFAGTRTFVLTNNGETAAPAIVGTVGGADASHYFFMDNCNGVALAPGASCTLLVDFRPTTTGAKVATVTYSGGFSTVVTFTGLAVNPALLTISPSVLVDDGLRPIGELDLASTTFTVGNTSGTAITSGISFTLSNAANYGFAGGGTCLLDGSQTLLPGASCTVNVRFNPTQLGVQATNVVASALTGGTVNGLMTGTGTQALVLTGQAPAFTAAQAGNPGTTQTLTFKNEADSSTTLIQTVLANTAGTDFSILSDGCGGQSLAANQSCTIDVHFTPSGLAASTRTGSVTISGVVVGTATTASANLSAGVLATP